LRFLGRLRKKTAGVRAKPVKKAVAKKTAKKAVKKTVAKTSPVRRKTIVAKKDKS
jgi:hypothetical protein